MVYQGSAQPISLLWTVVLTMPTMLRCPTRVCVVANATAGLDMSADNHHVNVIDDEAVNVGSRGVAGLQHALSMFRHGRKQWKAQAEHHRQQGPKG